ncbi:BNR repeat-containing protein [Leifsonia sp. McL0607]|uniref:BNR repeat-containing protein n=1 Tax=Leifsonia sp. McL0607 TaxID=3415672 RepID=UPI003CF3203B
MHSTHRRRLRFAASGTALAIAGAAITAIGAPALADDAVLSRTNLACEYVNEGAFTNPASTAWQVTASDVVSDASGREARAWAGYAAHQAIAENGDATYIGYFDEDRTLTIAKRGANDTAWTITPLGAKLEHDSHSNIELAFDTNGNLHVVARVKYSDTLRYWVTSQPGDLSTLASASMIPNWKDNGNSFEGWVSYPELYTGVDGQLFFRYQHGQPGGAYTNVYQFNAATKAWELSNPGTGYQGLAKVWAGWYTNPSWSAYPTVPEKGPDGKYHMIWTWRADGSPNSNSQIAYAVSDDLHVWKNVKGEVVSDASFTYNDRRPVVDDVPKGGGVLNGTGMALGFDAAGEPVISYIKYVGSGADTTTQLFTARPGGSASDNGWAIQQATSWSGKYDLAENILDPGFLNANAGARQVGDYLAIPYLCQQKGHTLYLDAKTGERVADVPTTQDTALPDEVTTSSFKPGNFIWPQSVRTEGSTDSSARLLKWEAGPWIVDGDIVPKWTYPVEGSPLTVFTLSR